jgi:CIC family chloride channel protein
MGYFFLLASGHYQVLGVGYATVQYIIDCCRGGGSLGLILLLALFFGKMLATCISLGAGSSGGVFSPSLFMGATLGAFVASAAALLFPHLGVSVPTYAMIGMAAMVGAATSAPMTAIVMIFEMTRDYNMILPLTIACALALGVRRALVTSDIYTIKLRGRGTPIPTDRTTNMFLVQPSTEIMNRNFKVLSQDMLVSAAINEIDPGTTKVLVSDGQRLSGFIRFGTIRYRMEKVATQRLGDLASSDFIIASERSNLNDVITRMSRRGRSYAIVVRGTRGVPRPDDVLGIIDREEIAQAVIKNHYA